MIDYRVRSISLLNLVNDIKSNRLIPDAYFQRNLVWREVHKKDFIETILLGYPFPQIFISKGKVNVETMSTVSCLIDGQQRTNAIKEYIEEKFESNGKFYSDLTEQEKSEFLKYEIAVIELDLENDDPKIQEIFQRINRTSNSLTTIEKVASEYATSEFMLVANFLTGQIDFNKLLDDDFRNNPNIPQEFYDWAKTKKVKKFNSLITAREIFTPTDLAKKVHLMHTLNVMSTLMVGFFNRNDKTYELLNDLSQTFYEKDRIVRLLEDSAELITKLKLKSKSYWYSKSNIFSLLVCLARKIDNTEEIDLALFKERLENFEKNIPSDYKLAAAEGVNGTGARQLRDQYIYDLLNN